MECGSCIFDGRQKSIKVVKSLMMDPNVSVFPPLMTLAGLDDVICSAIVFCETITRSFTSGIFDKFKTKKGMFVKVTGVSGTRILDSNTNPTLLNLFQS